MTEEKIKFKRIAYRAIAENLRIWKWHMAIAFNFPPSTDILCHLLPYPSTDFPLNSQQQKKDLSIMNVVFLAIFSMHIWRRAYNPARDYPNS